MEPLLVAFAVSRGPQLLLSAVNQLSEGKDDRPYVQKLLELQKGGGAKGRGVLPRLRPDFSDSALSSAFSFSLHTPYFPA